MEVKMKLKKIMRIGYNNSPITAPNAAIDFFGELAETLKVQFFLYYMIESEFIELDEKYAL